jgi:hypothetical protein
MQMIKAVFYGKFPIRDHPFSMYAQFPSPPCTHAYTGAHTPLRTYAKDRQSVPVNVDASVRKIDLKFTTSPPPSPNAFILKVWSLAETDNVGI